ncbi:MAG: AraC family transcriptional regulator [Rhodocyclaceae bacterium]|nr:MAG: AraC family transcriptional regulator [Rhodocyclaceae bacterium]
MNKGFLKSDPVFSNADPFAVSAYINRHIGKHDLSVTTNKGDATLQHATLGDVGVLQVHYGRQATVQAPSLNKAYHLQTVIDGCCAIRYGENEVVLGVGMAAMVPPNVEAEFNYSNDCAKLIVKIPEELIHKCCLATYGHVPKKGVRFGPEGLLLGDSQSFSRLIELLEIESKSTRGVVCASSEPLRLFLASKLFEWFPHDIESQTRYGQRDIENFFSVVDSYIDAHIYEDITADSLSTVCMVTRRTLYNLFSHGRGIAPTAYIKQKKLKKINEILQSSSITNCSVTKVALDFGFTHLGRFSAEYKQLFGEFPSDTIKKQLAS